MVGTASLEVAMPSLAQANGTLVWGGAMPAPGEAYRPSPSAVDNIGTGSTAPQAMVPRSSEAPAPTNAARALANDLIMPQASPQAIEPPVLETLVPTPIPNSAARRPEPAPAPAVAAIPPVPVPGADSVFGGTSMSEPPRPDPWATLKSVTPGAVTEADRQRIRQALPKRTQSLASLEPQSRPRIPEPVEQSPSVPRQPSPGWRNLSQKEALCRAALLQLGVEFTEPSPIRAGKSCGVPHPVRVTKIAKGVAMSPAATLNCDAAFRISRWVDQEVKPASRSNLGTHVTTLKNSSSYRCSRVAGSGGISQHATGNALDVAGFVMANGQYIDVEKKGTFSGGEKGFQDEIRRSACRWFGTVLGPGYDFLHRNHFHLDAREREKKFCR
ncbi:hypothetical protein DYI37_15600 [Fulvimarina endophytica]|uniref:Extensin-like C-terminal domain-containing protein n=2 Tax=Fulvimarina endophytica TaxID=2293836 RepID=A0A371X0B7_9HYPH|nr:hypothetical protein DYI37_15600 [Fulvimarina endophytica]